MSELESKRQLAVGDEDTHFLNNGNWVQRVLPQVVEHTIAGFGRRGHQLWRY